ncbi:hypothetical protein B0J14DRAFT_624339 [Halenospora varia]|nr:hypothetical protein B0J14DRAFT_624339 [Halenospora varia]
MNIVVVRSSFALQISRARLIFKVGGSLSGLIHAIVFQKLGHKVHVLEKSSEALLQSQAAGLNAGPDVQKFINECILTDKPYSKTCDLFEVVNIEEQVLYEMFKTKLSSDENGEVAVYETQKLVQEVKRNGEKMVVGYSDTTTGVSGVLQADLVIAADGSHSQVRKTVLPGLTPEYAGYITWRGAIPESSVSEETRKVLRDRVILFRTERGYTISYYVPSESGSLEAGDCQFIWIWYETIDEKSEEFQEIFTDIDGKKHSTTIPRGKMQTNVWAKKLQSATSLSTPFTELLQKTADPFVSAIRECSAPNAVFHDGKLLLVGDAFALFRPHVGSSTNQAAMQAMGLADLFLGKQTTEEWEKTSVEYARKTGALSKAFGEYCFTWKVPGSLGGAIKPDEELKND